MSKTRTTNRVFATTDAGFIKACKKAGIENTKRQASKYRRKQGVVYQASKGGK